MSKIHGLPGVSLFLPSRNATSSNNEVVDAQCVAVSDTMMLADHGPAGRTRDVVPSTITCECLPTLTGAKIFTEDVICEFTHEFGW